MVIRDFDRQNFITPNEVAKLVKSLPAAHTRGIQVLWYKPAPEFQAMHLPISPGMKGAYFPEYRSIIIYDLENKQLAKHIIAHEVGHYVYHRVLTSYQRKEWATQIGGKPPFVTDYAKTNLAEDFSECYAAFAVSHSTNISPRKRNFLAAQVFR